MKRISYVALFYLLFSFAIEAQVKLSNSGICHDETSGSYKRTKNFTPYSTLEECLNKGGRLPKGKSFSEKEKLNLNGKYERSFFGHGWDDADGDCQNTRHEILITQNTGNLIYTSSKKCAIKSGKWISIFTGKTYYSARDLDIDHIVPLKWAWVHGANKWTDEQRERFANAPANLVAVEASLNRQKGAKGIAKWLPPENKCQYISRFIRLVKEYKLVLSAKENKEFHLIKMEHCDK